MAKTKQLYVLLDVLKCHSTTSSFDLWMLKGGCQKVDVISLHWYIYILRANW